MLARKSFIQFISSGLVTVLGVLTTVVVARAYGPSAVGLIGYAAGLTGLFLIVSDLGFAQAHQKRISEGQDLGTANGTFYTIKAVLLGTAVAAIGIFLALAAYWQWDVWTDVVTRKVFLLVAASLVITDAASSLLATAQARQEVARYNAPTLAARLVKVVAVLIVAGLSLSVVALAGAYVLEAVVLLGIAWWFWRLYPRLRPTRVMFRRYWAYTVPFMVMTPLSLLAENIDKVLLKVLTDVQQVGYYVAVQSFVAVIPLLLSKPAMSVFFPHVSSLWARRALDEIRQTTDLLVRYLSLVTVPLLVILFTLRKELITLLLGPTFLPAADVFAVALGTVYVITVVRPYLNVLYGIERHQLFPVVSVGLLVITILGYLFLVPQSFHGLPGFGLGAVGVALTVLLVWLLDGIIKIAMFSRYTMIPFYGRIVIHLVAGALYYLTILLFQNLTGHTWLNPGLVVGLVAYLGLLWLTHEFSQADLVFLRQVLSPRALVREVTEDFQRNRPSL